MVPLHAVDSRLIPGPRRLGVDLSTASRIMKRIDRSAAEIREVRKESIDSQSLDQPAVEVFQRFRPFGKAVGADRVGMKELSCCLGGLDQPRRSDLSLPTPLHQQIQRRSDAVGECGMLLDPGGP